MWPHPFPPQNLPHQQPPPFPIPRPPTNAEAYVPAHNPPSKEAWEILNDPDNSLALLEDPSKLISFLKKFQDPKIVEGLSKKFGDKQLMEALFGKYNTDSIAKRFIGILNDDGKVRALNANLKENINLIEKIISDISDANLKRRAGLVLKMVEVGVDFKLNGFTINKLDDYSKLAKQINTELDTWSNGKELKGKLKMELKKTTQYQILSGWQKTILDSTLDAWFPEK